MAKTSPVYARIDTDLKENAENILHRLGISPSSAIQMLYSQIILTKSRCRTMNSMQNFPRDTNRSNPVMLIRQMKWTPC